jgi:tellurite resistance protein
MLSIKTEVTIKLCVVAALVDGVVSSEELTTTTQEIAAQYQESIDAVRDYTNELVERYRSENLDSEKALIAAIAALKELGIDGEDPSDALAAYAIANKVMWADGKKSQDERGFLENLYDEISKFSL